MPSERVELMRRAHEAMKRGDVDALVEMCTDDVVFLPGRSALQGAYIGRAGVQKFLADNAETFELYTLSWDEAHDAGEQVVAIGHVTVRPRGGGPEATIPAAFVFTFEDGKIARAEDFRDRSAALASVGFTA
jgi:ketosteroid isomerase-like protein